ncbi:hypothetical protein ACEQ8H_002752 [Pleosporales sp. CAS-2024a]
MSKASFNPATDISDQSGRVYFITGGTTGLGAESISYIAAHNPSQIFFSGRNEKRATELIAKVKHASPSTTLTFVPCDLSSLASVQTASKQLLSATDRLDVLMCNAGIMATPDAMSKDGYELQFATNHLGHALLINLLLPTLLRTAHAQQQPNPDTPKSRYAPHFWLPNKWFCYGQSKLANLLYARALAIHYPDITAVAVHPGFVRTDLHAHEGVFDRLLVNWVADRWVEPRQGAYTQTWAATTDRRNLVSGAYYEPVGVQTQPRNKQGKDEVLANELWDWTERELAKWVV